MLVGSKERVLRSELRGLVGETSMGKMLLTNGQKEEDRGPHLSTVVSRRKKKFKRNGLNLD